MKKQILFVLFLGLYLVMNADLKMFVQANRYLDEDFNTQHEIIYEIPYSSLKFTTNEYGYGSQVEVEYVITKNGQQHPGRFSNNIILTDFYRTVSDESFRDKILITLSGAGYSIEVKFTDVLNNTQRSWNYSFEQLSPDNLLSDIEISSNVVADTTGYMEKFHRNGKVFLVNTSNIFQKHKHSNLFLYYELYSFFIGSEQVNETITISSKGEVIKTEKTVYEITDSIHPIVRELDIDDFEQGLYRIVLETIVNSETAKRETVFSIKKDEIKVIRFFEDDEKDFDFIKLFLNANERATFNSLNEQSKLHFINRFWRSREQVWGVEDRIVPVILERLTHVNTYYGAMRTEGWETDRGRIYLKYGEPDEIIRLNTSMYDRDMMQDSPQIIHTRTGAKDFHIWKYRSAPRTSYVFIDSYSNRLFRLIYAGDDDTEVTNPAWKSLIGGDNFDESLLD